MSSLEQRVAAPHSELPPCPICDEMMAPHAVLVAGNAAWKYVCDDCDPIMQAKACPSCGKTMDERPVTNADGKIVGTQYKCTNPKCRAK